jgi:hypothetical protein
MTSHDWLMAAMMLMAYCLAVAIPQIFMGGM